MKHVVAYVLVLCVALLSACGGSNSSPTTPTPTPAPVPATPTRIINITGDLGFGNVNLGESATRVYTITNSGTAVLTFTGLNAVGGTGTAGFSAQQTSGTIAPGTSQSATLRFTPTVAQFYSNVLTVVGDQTSGNAAVNVSGTGVNNTPIFTRSGTGNTVFDMPTTVTRVRIVGDYGARSSNFIASIGGRNVVNVIIGTDTPFTIGTHYDAIALTIGGVVSITNSTGVIWSFTEVRQ